MPLAAVCDAHGAVWSSEKKMSQGEGYLLGARFVQKSAIQDKLLGRDYPMLEGSGITREQYRLQVESTQGASPWLICEECIGLLHLSPADKGAARAVAIRWWKDDSVPGHIPVTSTEARETKPAYFVVFGNGFKPSEEQAQAIIFAWLEKRKAALGADAGSGVRCELEYRPAAPRTVFIQMVSDVKQSHRGQVVDDVLVLDQRTGKDMALVAVWAPEDTDYIQPLLKIEAQAATTAPAAPRPSPQGAAPGQWKRGDPRIFLGSFWAPVDTGSLQPSLKVEAPAATTAPSAPRPSPQGAAPIQWERGALRILLGSLLILAAAIGVVVGAGMEPKALESPALWVRVFILFVVPGLLLLCSGWRARKKSRTSVATEKAAVSGPEEPSTQVSRWETFLERPWELLFGTNVDDLKKRRDIPGLISALCFYNAHDSAAKVLSELRDPRTVELLIAALNDNEVWVRGSAASFLGNSGDPRAVDPLIAALNDSEWVVRRTAAIALGELGDARAVGPLIFALEDKGGWGLIGPRLALALAAKRSPALAEAISKEIEAGTFKNAELTVSAAAAYALEIIGTPEARQALSAFRARKRDLPGVSGTK